MPAVADDTPILEIAANSLDSASAAQDGGADRIELCGALELGGLTPSPGLIALARARVRIPLYVLIRPRAGDFVYTNAEFATMRRDIEACVALGCDGIVVGALDPDGGVDLPRCRELVAAAGALGVTFHRAFDACADQAHALEQVVALGCERILTSGGSRDARLGADAIRALVARAAGRIAVMAGAGVDAANIAGIRERSGAREFHASARRALASRSRHAANAELGMAAGEQRTDVDQVRAMAAALRPGPG